VNRRWLILADDLTGAADAAVAFARRGHEAEVHWGATPLVDGADVHALNLDSRGTSAADAAARHRDAVHRGHAAHALFKKIDSTLRGHPAVEMAAIAAALRERGRPSWGLLAPASPAMRRTTRDGRVFVDGRPLEDSATWKRDHSYPGADLTAVVRSAGLCAITLPLAELRGDASVLRGAFAAAAASAQAADTILVSDSETDGDLDRLVGAAHEFAPGFFAGTAGLAHALARCAPGKPSARLTLDPTSRGTLVAVGTAAEVSRAAARHLAAHEGIDLVRVDSSGLPGSAQQQDGAATDIASRLTRGETVVALLDVPNVAGDALDSRYTRSYAASLAGALEQMGALVVSGGETATALLAQCDVHGIRLLGEIEPGVALGMTRGRIEVPVVTKPGAFGDEESLRRCLDALNDLRRTA
jgi:uncharacterized protein YgbK (DUF1537 family)